MAKKRRCDYCDKLIGEKEQGYGLNIEMFALADPLELTEEDLERDFRAELEELIQQLEDVDVSEAEDQVHEIYRFILCGKCRQAIHHRLKNRLAMN